MKYDVLHTPGPPIGGCGEVCISPDLADGHARGDRLSVIRLFPYLDLLVTIGVVVRRA